MVVALIRATFQRVPYFSVLPKLPHARQVFDKIPHTVTDLLSHFCSDPVTLPSIHCLTIKSGLIRHLPVHTRLITAYARANRVNYSQSLFEENSSANDVISWNAMISAAVMSSEYHIAISTFQKMVEKCVAYDATTLVVVLSAVSRIPLLKLKHGTAIHGISVKTNLSSDVYLSNSLISMYAKSGDWSSSELVFRTMQFRDAASWNAVISGAHFGQLYENSMYYFTEMKFHGFRPDEVSISTALSACTCLGCIFDFGESVHGLAIKTGYEGIQTSPRHKSVSNALVSFYARYGDTEAAKRVFSENHNKSVVSWNSIIKGLIELQVSESGNEVFQFLRDMQFSDGIKPDAVTLITLIPLCGELDLVREIKSVHGYSVRHDMQTVNFMLTNSLLSAYLRSENIIYARELFRNISSKDLSSWNAMISGYADNNFLHRDAVNFFRELVCTGLRCNLFTFLGVLRAVSKQENLHLGRLIHGMVIKYGYSFSISAINALMHMYMSCDMLSVSMYILKSIIAESDIISWNTIIAGCVQKRLFIEAIETFQFMHSNSNLKSDSITLASVLSACAELKAQIWGDSIHGLLLKNPIQFDFDVRKALVTMYLKMGDFKSANKVYEYGCEQNFCLLNCMLSSFVQNGEGDKGLELYYGNRDRFLTTNEITIVSLICACSQTGDLRRGKEINGYVYRNGLQKNIYITSSLIDMYSKCGMLDLSLKTFELSEEKPVPSWNSMISAYGLHGRGKDSIRVFHEMYNSGVEPTKCTFVALLSACGQTGLVKEGLKYYHLMPHKYGVQCSVEHVVCLIDMLGRAGRVKEAYEIVKGMDIVQDHGVWGAILSACSDGKFGSSDVVTGMTVAGYLIGMEPENSGYYVTLCNLLASRGMWSDVVEVRRSLRDKGLVKAKGFSFSVIDNLA